MPKDSLAHEIHMLFIFMISASNIEKTQEVFIKTDVDEIKSEAEEAGGNWQENVRIEDVRSENSNPNPNLVENPIETIPPVNKVTCKYCPTTFTDPFGMAKLSHHVLTFHYNHNPEIHRALPQPNMPTPPGTPRPLRTPGFPRLVGTPPGTPGPLGTPGFHRQVGPPPRTPGFPGRVGQNRQTTNLTPPISPEILFQYPISDVRRRPTSTFIPSRPDMGHRPYMGQRPNMVQRPDMGQQRPDMGQRPFVSQQPLPHPVTPNDIMKEYMLRQQERERIRYQQTMGQMHPGAQQVIEVPTFKQSIYLILRY
jgi:hypothetical protein